MLFHWDSQQKKADGYFGEHQGLKSLNPFAVGVFHKLNILPMGEIDLVPSKTVVNLYDNETTGDDFTERCEENGIIVPADIADNPCPSRQSQSYSHGCQERGDDFQRNDSSTMVVIFVLERES